MPRGVAAALSLGLLVVVGALVAPSAGAASAQTGFERIASFAAEVVVESSGAMQVTETIDYDFGATSRRGIFREIDDRQPVDPRPGDGGRRYVEYVDIEGITVTSPTGAPTDVAEERAEGALRIRIGDPDLTVTGRHTYIVRYRVEGAARRYSDHDEISWDVTGDRTLVSTGQASAVVRGPAVVNRVACYAGPAGSTLPCASAETSGSTATFSHGELGPRSGLTVVAAFPKGTFADVEPRRSELWTPQRAFEVSPATVAAGAGTLAAVLGLVGYLLARNARDRRYVGSAVDAAFGNATGDHGPVPLLGGREANPVEFVPPEGILPGHMGTLWDEVAHPLDVSAMIVDLAVRGYLRIEEIEAPSDGVLFGIGRREGDYRFVRLRPPDAELWKAERVLLEGLFRDGESVVLSELTTNFVPRLQLVEGALYDDAVAAGWFPTRPDRVRARWNAIGLGALVVGAGLAFLLIRFTRWGLVALPLPLLGLLLLALGSRFPHRTAKGTALLGRVRGFKELFDVGEGERQRFAESRHLFSQYLPYAIVFGMAERWAETFEALGLSPQEMGVGTWYVSSYGYHPLAFGAAMSSFSKVTTGSIAAAAPSSSGGSGFGGGGFSGGGFGGGGTGSW